MSIARLAKALAALWAASLLVSCSSMDEGVVVRKSRRPRKIEPYAQPEPSYWVEIKGQDTRERTMRRRIPLFDWEWAQLSKGDRISLRDYNPFRLTRARTARLTGQPATSAAARGTGVPADSRSAGASKRRKAQATASRPAAVASASPGSRTAVPTELKFREVEARALEDQSVRALKAKIHAAKTDAEQTQASQEFQRAKFNKMRELDRSLAPLIDRAESAAAKDEQGPAPAASPVPVEAAR